MQCVILAGGLGTRMRPLTETVPKIMLPVAGRPFGEWQLEYLVAHGVSDVVYVIGYHGETIRRHFGDGERHGVHIRYADEGAALRGTGGALRFAFDSGLLEPAFLLVYGDSFTPLPIADVWGAFERSGKPGLMTVLCNEERWDRSNVLFDDGRIVVYDKSRRHPRSAEMRHIDYGLSALRRDIVDARLPDIVPWDLAHLFHALSLEDQLAGFEAAERFYEIGSPAGLRDFEEFITAARSPAAQS